MTNFEPDLSHPNAALFTYQEECQHNRNTLLNYADQYAYWQALNMPMVAAKRYQWYMEFLHSHKLNLDTDGVE